MTLTRMALLTFAGMLIMAAVVVRVCSTLPYGKPLRHATLHSAAVFAPDEIPRLVEAGVSVGSVDQDGCTPLWMAARFDKPDSVKELLRLGADPDSGGPRGEAPLLVATFLGSQSADTLCVRELIAAKADLNVFSEANHESPLHYAVQSGNREVVQLLLAAGANANATSSHGDTPLQGAVVRGNAELADLLLGAGADPELRNKAGFRPIDQAGSNEKEVQAVFRSHGADDQQRPERIAAARAARQEPSP